MYIAIDDTYGPSSSASRSQYITSDRRTHVAVVFADDEVDFIREQIRECLAYLGSLLPTLPAELHFSDIYNRRGVWKRLDNSRNLYLIESFVEIYTRYRWKVFLQTIHDYTQTDHPDLSTLRAVDGLDPTNRADLSLLLLCLQIRLAYKELKPTIRLIVDHGREAAGRPFGTQLFRDWGASFSGKYDLSSAEPLLQVADFISFCINRTSYLSTKPNRSDTDNAFLSLIGGMGINCDKLKPLIVKPGFTTEDVDALLRSDRVEKGLE